MRRFVKGVCFVLFFCVLCSGAAYAKDSSLIDEYWGDSFVRMDAGEDGHFEVNVYVNGVMDTDDLEFGVEDFKVYGNLIDERDIKGVHVVDMKEMYGGMRVELDVVIDGDINLDDGSHRCRLDLSVSEKEGSSDPESVSCRFSISMDGHDSGSECDDSFVGFGGYPYWMFMYPFL